METQNKLSSRPSDEINVDKSVITNNKIMSNTLNEFFANDRINLVKDIPTTVRDATSDINGNFLNSMCATGTSDTEIINVVTIKY